MVTEAVRAAIGLVQGPAQARSRATVAAGTSGASPPVKTIPQRINREILVRGADLPAELARRTPAEIIQAINNTSAKQGAIAARKLPSGDTVVTSTDQATKDWHT